MPATWTHRRIRLPWGRLSVYTAGEGPPLLLMHGLGGSGRYWSGMADVLARRRTLIAPDLPGFGRSDKPRTDYSRDFHVEAMKALLAAVGAERDVDVAGHSMGGILAALLAAREPELVVSLALVATPFPRRRMHPNRLPHSALRRVTYRAVQRILPVIAPLVRSSTYPRAVVVDYLRHTLDSYQRTSDALLWDPSSTDELAGLDAAMRDRPQLMLYSAEDSTIASDSLDRWREVLPHAEVKVIAGAHQLLLRDHFATLAQWYPSRGAAVRA